MRHACWACWLPTIATTLPERRFYETAGERATTVYQSALAAFHRVKSGPATPTQVAHSISNFSLESGLACGLLVVT